MTTLTGKNAIVTGGSQGLGRAIVEHYLAAGARVIFCARSEKDVRDAEADLRELGEVEGVVCDVSKQCDAQDLVEHALTQLGGVDILVNNAGIQGPIGPIESVSWEDWARTMEINVYGVAHLCRALIPHLRQAGKGGSIINISGGGATNPMPRFSAYAASKAALVRLTETLALELKDAGITVNAIAPGAMHTRMMKEVIAAGPDATGADYHARNLKWAAGAATPPELGARLCVYLAGPDARGITGKLLSAQWDPWEILHEHLEDIADTDVYALRRITPKDRGFTWDPKANL
jgi:NAD(P)-dependent dehydrogenase (short-subunit alcohol dehydrogenase family)